MKSDLLQLYRKHARVATAVLKGAAAGACAGAAIAYGRGSVVHGALEGAVVGAVTAFYKSQMEPGFITTTSSICSGAVLGMLAQDILQDSENWTIFIISSVAATFIPNRPAAKPASPGADQKSQPGS